jgi:hypothetical protein
MKKIKENLIFILAFVFVISLWSVSSTSSQGLPPIAQAWKWVSGYLYNKGPVKIGTGGLTVEGTAVMGATYSLVPVLTGQSGAVNIDAAYCKNGYVEFSGAGTGTLPAGVAGYAITVRNVGAHAVSVKPNGVETLTLNGTALAGGNKATNTSTTNDSITLIYTGTTWVIIGTSTWTDGGA